MRKSGAVNFHLDTGSSDCIAGETDLAKMEIEISKLPISPKHVGGWGGITETHQIDHVCIVLMDENKKAQEFEVPTILCAKNPKERKVNKKKGVVRTWSWPVPSIIGRDFLRDNDLLAHIDIKKNDIYLHER